MKNKRPLRAYMTGDDTVYMMDKRATEAYPSLQCAYLDCNCFTRCAHFNVTKRHKNGNWKTGSPIFCGNVQIGTLS